jgi:hypothetical protein
MLLGALTPSSTSQVRCENYGIPGPWMLFCDLWICRRKNCTVAYNVWRRRFCSKRMIHKIMCWTAFWSEQNSRWSIFLHRGEVYLLKKERYQTPCPERQIGAKTIKNGFTGNT